jgi:nitrogen fixation protein FixH
MTQPFVARKNSDRWIPWSFVAFFVLLVLADGVFVALALTSWTGLDTEQAYAQGLMHNQTLARTRAQDERGLQSSLDVAPEGEKVRVEFALADRAGDPIAGGAAEVIFHRPTQAGLDFAFPLLERSPGRYSGVAPLAALGQWEVRIHFLHAAGDYQANKRVVLR